MWSVITLAGCCFLHATFALGQDSWTQGFPSQAPSGRNFHAMVYDADRNEVVLFGGIVRGSMVLYPADCSQTGRLVASTNC